MEWFYITFRSHDYLDIVPSDLSLRMGIAAQWCSEREVVVGIAVGLKSLIMKLN